MKSGPAKANQTTQWKRFHFDGIPRVETVVRFRFLHTVVSIRRYPCFMHRRLGIFYVGYYLVSSIMSLNSGRNNMPLIVSFSAMRDLDHGGHVCVLCLFSVLCMLIEYSVELEHREPRLTDRLVSSARTQIRVRASYRGKEAQRYDRLVKADISFSCRRVRKRVMSIGI